MIWAASPLPPVPSLVSRRCRLCLFSPWSTCEDCQSYSVCSQLEQNGPVSGPWRAVKLCFSFQRFAASRITYWGRESCVALLCDW